MLKKEAYKDTGYFVQKLSGAAYERYLEKIEGAGKIDHDAQLVADGYVDGESNPVYALASTVMAEMDAVEMFAIAAAVREFSGLFKKADAKVDGADADPNVSD